MKSPDGYLIRQSMPQPQDGEMTDGRDEKDVENHYTSEWIVANEEVIRVADAAIGSGESTKGQQTEENEKDPTLVEWDDADDPDNPFNWSPTTKWLITCSMGSITFTVTFASSVFSAAIPSVAHIFGISSEVATLGLSLFVLGFSLGPIVLP
jgi:hypothetical protein